jgi:cell volume regulation protein A
MMSLGEPIATAIVLTITGLLLALSVIATRAPKRVPLPVPILFMVLGMLAGEQGVGGLVFDDYAFAFRMGTVALVLILFDGGLNTPLKMVKLGIRPAGALATVGVALTAGLTAVGAHFFGFSWGEGLLLGAVVSPTDAAVVFSVLRGSGVHISKRLAATLELESGLNDPMAVILTVALTQHLYSGASFGWHTLLEVPVEIGLGAAMGIGLGLAGRAIVTHVTLPAGGLYPVMTLSLGFLAFGVPTLFHGSGFLAVYVASLILGNGPMPYRSSLLHVHNSVAWLAQIFMFLLLGILVYPSQLLEVAPLGLGIGLVVTFIARPLAVFICLAPFRFPLREAAYISWVGLRGAVPVILAMFPVLAHGQGAQHLFDVVFFVVVINSIVPGSTVPRVTRWLGLELKHPPPAPAILEINKSQLLAGDVMTFYIEPSTLACESPIAELPFPAGASVLMAVRKGEMLAPRGNTVLKPGDHVYVFCRPQDKHLLRKMFGSDSKEGLDD